MLLCANCGRVIAMVDRDHIRYGGCTECRPVDVARKLRDMSKERGLTFNQAVVELDKAYMEVN